MPSSRQHLGSDLPPERRPQQTDPIQYAFGGPLLSLGELSLEWYLSAEWSASNPPEWNSYPNRQHYQLEQRSPHHQFPQRREEGTPM